MTSDPGGHERRSTRLVIRIPVNVSGVATRGETISEKGETLLISRHGALIHMPSSAKIDTTLEVMNLHSHQVEKFRVVSVQKRKDGYNVGVEILTPQEEFWAIRFPPETSKG